MDTIRLDWQPMDLHKSEMFGQQPEPHTRPPADNASFLTLIPVWDDPDSRHQGAIAR